MNSLGGFVGFCSRLRVPMSLGQRTLAAVCIDGSDPVDLPAAERAKARTIFGRVDRFSHGARHVSVWKKGARVGGTLFGGIDAVYSALTVPLAHLGPGEQAFAVLCAPDLRLARQALRYAAGVLETPELRSLVEANTSDAITLRRPDGKAISIEALPATRGGSALRGRSLVFALLSECAFFRDESFVVNDVDIFKAVAPRVVPGGHILIESTPWGEAGLLFDLFSANWERPSTGIAAHCPTLEMRDDEEIRSMVARERERDPENALREYDANFIAGGTRQFFDAAAIDAAVDPALHVPEAL